MGDVGIDDQQIVRADDGGVAVIGRAVDGDAFAENIVIADLHPGDAALPFQVLRFHANGGEGEDFIFPSEFCVAVNDDVRVQFAAIAERHVFTNDAIGPDFATGTNPGLGMNNRR